MREPGRHRRAAPGPARRAGAASCGGQHRAQHARRRRRGPGRRGCGARAQLPDPPALRVGEQGGVGHVGPRVAERAVQRGQPVPQPAGVLAPAQQPGALGAQPGPAARAAARRGSGAASRCSASTIAPSRRTRRAHTSPSTQPHLVGLDEQRGRGQLGQLPVGRRGQSDPPVLGARRAVGDGDGQPLLAGQRAAGRAAPRRCRRPSGTRRARRADAAAGDPLGMGQGDDQRRGPGVAGGRGGALRARAEGARGRRAGSGSSRRSRATSARQRPTPAAAPDRSRPSSRSDVEALGQRVVVEQRHHLGGRRAPTSAAPSSSARASRGCRPSSAIRRPRSVDGAVVEHRAERAQHLLPGSQRPGRRRVPPAQPGCRPGCPSRPGPARAGSGRRCGSPARGSGAAARPPASSGTRARAPPARPARPAARRPPPTPAP